jgi:hypothetical protein
MKVYKISSINITFREKKIRFEIILGILPEYVRANHYPNEVSLMGLRTSNSFSEMENEKQIKV